jgi:hypothetical protein
MTPNERAEFDFLLERSSRAGTISFTHRDTGRSSNAMVAHVLGGPFPEPSQYPADRSDYAACLRAARQAPRHLRPRIRQVLAVYRSHLRSCMATPSQSEVPTHAR